MKIRDKILAILFLLPIMSGCVKEDYSNCPEGLYIAFEPINPKHIYPDKVQRVSLYFYNPESGDLAADFHYEKDELRVSDRAAFVPQIPAGTYRVVAVINDGIYTRTAGTGNYTTLHTMLDDEEMAYKPADLFTAEKDITVTVNTTMVVPVETMAIVKHNNDIYLNIIYDDYNAQEGMTFTSWIEGSDYCYEYAARRNTLHALSWPWDIQTNVSGMPIRFSYSVMRLSLASDLVLHLQETPVSRAEAPRHYSFNLVDALARIIDETNPDNQYLYDTDQELEYNDEFELTIKIGKEKVQIAVGIDRWDTIGGRVEL